MKKETVFKFWLICTTCIAVNFFLNIPTWAENLDLTGMSNEPVMGNSGGVENNWSPVIGNNTSSNNNDTGGTAVNAAGNSSGVDIDAGNAEYDKAGSALIEQLNSGSAGHGQTVTAVELLKDMNYSDAGPTLLDIAKNSSDELLSRNAIVALGDMKYTPAGPDLIAILQGDKQYTLMQRVCACDALANMGYTEVAPVLLALAQNNAPDTGVSFANIHKSAIVALGDLKDTEAVGFLTSVALNKEGKYNTDLREAAINSLAKIGAEGTGETLMTIVRDFSKQGGLSTVALQALTTLHYTQACPELWDIFQTKVKSGEFAKGIISALGQMDYKDAAPGLLGVAKNYDDYEIQEAAVKALGDMHYTDAGPDLLEIFERARDTYYYYVGVAAIDALAKMQYTPAVGSLLTEVHRKITASGDAIFWESSCREHAIRALGYMGYTQAGEDLLALAKNKNDSFRNVAMLALGDMKYTAAGADLVDIVTQKQGKEELSVRNVAIESLGKMRYTQGGQDLVSIAIDKNNGESIRKTAISALSAMGYKVALTDLAKITEDNTENLGVRINAARAMNSLK